MTLPFVTDTGLSFFSDSLSNLGAQQTSGNWIMNIALILMSLAAFIYGAFRLKGHSIEMIVLVFFCACFFLTGYYQMAGNERIKHYNYTQNTLHALFSMLSGISFSLLCLTILFRTIKTKYKLLAAIVFGLTILLHFLHIQFPI